MQQIKKSSLNNSLIIVISSLLTSYFFIQVYPIEQRAVDAGLVLAGFVYYPDQTSPMTEYFIKSWTSIHQIAKFFLNLDWSILNVSKLIIFITTVFYFLGIMLTVNSASRSILIGILVAFMILVFRKSFGDTDYPSMIFSEHTYGMLSLAIVTFIFGLLFSGNLFLAGFFSALSISIHPIVGIWITGIIFISLIFNKYFFKFSLNYNKLIGGFSIGIILTIISLYSYYISTADFTSSFDLVSYNNYMKYWEGHRTSAEYHPEYFIKTFILLVCACLAMVGLKNNLTENFRFGIICVSASIIFSTSIYFIYKIFFPYMPNLITLIMPSRFTIVHSVIGWPLILSLLFVFVKKIEIKSKITNNFATILIFLIILLYSASHYKDLIKLQNLLIKNTSTQIASLEDKNFWNEIKNAQLDGYIITSFSSSTISMRKSLKPIMLDVTSFDFVPYFPNTAKSLSKVVEEIYGVEFTNPPLELKNSGSLSDKIIKINFEKYSKKKWQQLFKDFNLIGVIVPINWKMKLTPYTKGSRFIFYVI